MTRTEFIRAYADRSGLSSECAAIGIIEIGRDVMLALPCACEDEGCEGWAMVTASTILSHLELYAPDKLRVAYREAISQK